MDRKVKQAIPVLLITLAVLFLQLACNSKTTEAPKTEATAAAPANSACTLPTTMAGSDAETAWKIFVAINCASSLPNTPLVWETWTEQLCWLNPTAAACQSKTSSHTLHGSALAAKKRTQTPSIEGTPCGPMTTKTDKSLAKWAPTNLSATPFFCEEVYFNQAEAAYLTTPVAGQPLTLKTSAGQQAFAASTAPGAGTVNFPTSAIEVKVDWVPVDSLDPKKPTFNCTNPPKGLYTEVIQGKCYALAGFHLSSKLSPKWLWATFEPQSTITNPNLCDPTLYSACNDTWGSQNNPTTMVKSPHGTTPPVVPTAQLTALITAAGLANSPLASYVLVGTQTNYVDSNNLAIPLGSSFTEFNAGVLPQQASCITCHDFAMVSNGATPVTPPGAPFPAFAGNAVAPKGPASPNTGNPTPPPFQTPAQTNQQQASSQNPAVPTPGTTWIPLDFSWLAAFMPAK